MAPTRRVFRIVGAGRAGGAFAEALSSVGWIDRGFVRRGDDLSGAAADVDLLVLATPDGVISEVAADVRPVATTVVAHLAGSLGLEALAPHERRAGIHPLVALPNAAVGARRLQDTAWFGIAGDPLAGELVADLGGRSFEVADADRATYHAAAVVASNHLVALFGQVDRLASGIGVPPEAYLDLARATLDNVADLGPAAALTGPVARGDWATVARHLRSIPADEQATYRVLAAEAARLCGRELPQDLDEIE